MHLPDFEKLKAVKEENLQPSAPAESPESYFRKAWRDWGDEYHTERARIEQEHGITILGQGRESLVFTSPDLPDTVMLSYTDNKMTSWDDRLDLVRRTYQVKVQYYLNRIMKTLFPGNFARLHFASYDPDDLGEVHVREKITAVSDAYFASVDSNPWHRASEVDTSREPWMTGAQLQRLCEQHDFPVALDDVNPNNFIPTASGETYVDGELLITIFGSPLSEHYTHNPAKAKRMKRESYEALGNFLDYIDQAGTYSDADTQRVMQYIDRIKAITEEFLTYFED